MSNLPTGHVSFPDRPFRSGKNKNTTLASFACPVAPADGTGAPLRFNNGIMKQRPLDHIKNHNLLTTDFLVIGGGIIGLSIAIELKRLYRDCSVTLLEKENRIAEHASGRNSGVLHAGFYYTKDSLKAKFTKDGNEALTHYCLDKGIQINRCGKLVVARNAEELHGLAELLRRANHNDIELQEISEKDAKRIEPRVKTYRHALFSPNTSSVDPEEVMKSMLHDAEREGIDVRFGVKYLDKSDNIIQTNLEAYSTGYFVNAAGLYADKIARDYGFSENYRILPFKGLYLYSSEPKGRLKTNIYPVPNLKNPFLGVHTTVTVDGSVKIGPTAIPAFWREHYQGLDNFNFGEMLEILWREIGLFISSQFDFKRLAFEELKKYSREYLTLQASELVEGIKKADYTKWGRPGVRAQLINTKDRTLEMDFVIEGDEKSMHVLNAVSPGFTCSIPFAKFVVGKIQNHIS
jgi:L-2-hydroxyglutarate oxidase LhgO